MAIFEYKGRNNSGGLITGDLEAASATSVASQLLSSGITPVNIKEKVEKNDPFKDFGNIFKSKKPPEISEMVMFSRQMYALLRTGIPVNQAIGGIQKSIRNEYFVEVLQEIQNDLESGQELSTSLKQHTRIFSPLFIAMVAVGENTGRLDEAFLQISRYMEYDKETRQRVKSALRYPTFVMIAISIAITVINIFVIPAFAKIFESANVELPLATRILMMTSDFFVNYWGFLLMALVMIFGSVRAWLKTKTGRYNWDKYKLRLPLVGDIIQRATLGRFARSFAMSVSAGVPLTQALSVVAKAVDNHFVGERILDIRNAVERGATLTQSASETGMFTPLVIQMLSVGEETGIVDEMMQEVAGFYEREVEYDVKNLSSTIEPVLISAIGVMVLILALGIFLPMWDMSSVMS